MKRVIMLTMLVTTVLAVQALAQVPRTVIVEHNTATW